MNAIARLWISLGLNAIVVATLFAEPLQIAYCYSKESSGGIAVVSIDDQSGKILHQSVVYESAHCLVPKKLRATDDGRTYLLTHDSDTLPLVFVVDTVDTRSSKLVELPARPDELRIAGPLAIVTCGQDWVVTIDINSRSILGMWDCGKILKPRGNGPQDVLITPDRRYAAVSFQKDSRSGKKWGGRIVLFELPGMNVRSDILLARDYRDWQIDPRIRSSGPGPEVMFLDERADRFLVTLDHYGAVAIMKWSELVAGKLSTIDYLPTSADGSWGVSFPDRGTMFHVSGKPYCLVTNASEQGGAVVIDLVQANVIARFATPPGVDTPCYIPELRAAFAVCPGKTKHREGDEVVKEYFPRNELFVFGFSAPSLPEATLTKLSRPHNLFALGVLSRANASPYFVLASGKNRADTLITFDPATRTFLDSQPAIGFVADFADD